MFGFRESLTSTVRPFAMLLSAFASLLAAVLLLPGCHRPSFMCNDSKPSPETDFITIHPGTFEMGSPDSQALRFDNETLHGVRITKSYELARAPVTVAQFRHFVETTGFQTAAEKEGWAYGAWNLQTNAWDKFVGANWKQPGFDQASDHPVVDIDWNDAIAYCRWLSETTHRTCRLPTEAEWEYACRAGSSTAYVWGEDPTKGAGWANCSDLVGGKVFEIVPPFDWDDGYLHTSPVGAFKPNAWGLHDMIGNTLEWCSDWFADYPTGEVTDPTGPAEGQQRCLRGGAFLYGPKHCRSAFRGRNDPTFRNFYIGFRIAREL